MFDKSDFSSFVGGWSYEGDSLYHACRSISIEDTKCLNILEFGCGDSTVKLYDILKTKLLPNTQIKYHCYENDPAFAILHPKIVCTLYHKDNIDSVCLPSEKYDFVLIDGPHGVDRMKWYAKVNHVIKEGTVILIDDWNHYKEFDESLVRDIGSCWDYDTVFLADFPFPTKSYKIVKISRKKVS